MTQIAQTHPHAFQAASEIKPAGLMTRLRRFLGDDRDGSMAVEAMFALPIMMWSLFAGYVYFDAQRMKTLNIKSAYTVADVLSREANVDSGDMDMMHGLAWMLSGARDDIDVSLRVSVVRYDTDTDSYYVQWSQEEGDHWSAMTTGEANTMSDQLPMATDLDSLIVVQTYMMYTPIFDAGLSDTPLESIIVTRPRYTPGLCWDNGANC